MAETCKGCGHPRSFHRDHTGSGILNACHPESQQCPCKTYHEDETKLTSDDSDAKLERRMTSMEFQLKRLTEAIERLPNQLSQKR